MGNPKIAQLTILLINLGTLLTSLACPTCPNPKPPVVKPPTLDKPPIVHAPLISAPLTVPKPYPPPPPQRNPYPPPPPKNPYPPPPKTCSIDTSKLTACVDALGGVGAGQRATEACCPVVEGLVPLDAAVCLCAAIKAKVLNIAILIDIAVKILVGCGKTPPSGFQCHA